LEWFETCSCKPIPRDLPSSFTQLYDTVFPLPPFHVSLQHTEAKEVKCFRLGEPRLRAGHRQRKALVVLQQERGRWRKLRLRVTGHSSDNRRCGRNTPKSSRICCFAASAAQAVIGHEQPRLRCLKPYMLHPGLTAAPTWLGEGFARPAPHGNTFSAQERTFERTSFSATQGH